MDFGGRFQPPRLGSTQRGWILGAINSGYMTQWVGLGIEELEGRDTMSCEPSHSAGAGAPQQQQGDLLRQVEKVSVASMSNPVCEEPARGLLILVPKAGSHPGPITGSGIVGSPTRDGLIQIDYLGPGLRLANPPWERFRFAAILSAEQCLPRAFGF